MMSKINFLCLEALPIIQQLELEEALLRLDEENWCLINTSAPPAIVMGVSAAPQHFINLGQLTLKPVPLIRRFSGGGTVFVDQDTIFVTFIFNEASYPDKALRWSEHFYAPVFDPLPFQVKENDYAIEERKCGGNAQYFRKQRFLHHTSFLFDFENANMDYLLYPERTPKYRQGRDHCEFLTRLKEYFPSKPELLNKLINQLQRTFAVEERRIKDVLHLKGLPHRKATALVTP